MLEEGIALFITFVRRMRDNSLRIILKNILFYITINEYKKAMFSKNNNMF